MTDDPMGDVSGDASNLTPVPPTANAPPRTTSPEGVSAPEGLQAKEEAQDRETMTQPPSHMTDDSMGAVSGEASDPTPLPLMPETRTPAGSPTGNAAGEDPGALTARIDHLQLGELQLEFWAAEMPSPQMSGYMPAVRRHATNQQQRTQPVVR